MSGEAVNTGSKSHVYSNWGALGLTLMKILIGLAIVTGSIFEEIWKLRIVISRDNHLT
jgi:hypothetical protein